MSITLYQNLLFIKNANRNSIGKLRALIFYQNKVHLVGRGRLSDPVGSIWSFVRAVNMFYVFFCFEDRHKMFPVVLILFSFV